MTPLVSPSSLQNPGQHSYTIKIPISTCRPASCSPPPLQPVCVCVWGGVTGQGTALRTGSVSDVFDHLPEKKRQPNTQ